MNQNNQRVQDKWKLHFYTSRDVVLFYFILISSKLDWIGSD